ncbi:hypothetical protein QE152_g15944 [Popillia japonica]|uniref:Uncharacterized protein n=1 Tax=Popillia japonica TaxID=7064 RepID=A0AAW1L6J3_POPJA
MNSKIENSQYCSLKKTDKKLQQKLRELLSENIICEFTDPNLLYDYVCTANNQAYVAATTVTVKRLRNHTPIKLWITPRILREINVRDKKFRDWKNCSADPATKMNLRNAYKQQRNRVTMLIRLEKRKHFTKLFNDSRGDMKETWKNINNILGRTNKTTSYEKI